MAGRGFGKTKAGAEWVRNLAETKQAYRIALVAPTATGVRDVVVKRESAILSVSPKGSVQFTPVRPAAHLAQRRHRRVL